MSSTSSGRVEGKKRSTRRRKQESITADEVSTTARTEYLAVLITHIHENPNNPRKTFAAIDDLAASMNQLGQIVPGLARPHPSIEGAYELVAGHRRFRACQHAGIETFRVVVKEMDDATALKVMLVENGQRQDVPALEEAESYRQLRDVHGLSVAQIASDVGRSEPHVYQRLKLTELVAGVQELLRNGNLLLKTALLFARLDEEGQHKALKRVTDRFQFVIDEGDVLNHREVDHFVLMGTRKLMQARWALDDAMLVQQAGSCVSCSKRTQAQAQLFQIGEPDRDDVCLDEKCWEGKVTAHADRELAAAFEKGQEIVDPKDSKAIWKHGSSEPAEGWIDVEQSITWAMRRQYHTTDKEQERALEEIFPELGTYQAGLAAWNRRAGAYLEEHGTGLDISDNGDSASDAADDNDGANLHELPEDFEPEPEEPSKVWADVIGLEHPAIRLTLDRDGHARRVMTKEDLARALWELGHKDAHKVMRPRHEQPKDGSPEGTYRQRQQGAWKEQREREAVRTAEAHAVRAQAMADAQKLSLDELVLAVTLMVCRYGVHYQEATALCEALGIKPGTKDKRLYLDAPNQALWQHATDALTSKRTMSKDRLLLALRILAQRPVMEPSHDEVLHAILGTDIKSARKAGRAEIKAGK